MKINKHNKYFKATLLSKSDEDCLYNTFSLYVMAIAELIVIAVLQGAWNILSIGAITTASILLFITAYRLGVHHGSEQ